MERGQHREGGGDRVREKDTANDTGLRCEQKESFIGLSHCYFRVVILELLQRLAYPDEHTQK